MNVLDGGPTAPLALRAAALLLDVANRVVAALLILLFLPILAGCYLLVRTSSRGPAVFRQVRVGRYGRVFTIYKFRTMRLGADAELAAVLAEAGHGEITPFFKIPADPRITRVGRVLRATSLDELPQLVNVLRGDMNLVGPRPQSPAEVATYDVLTWRRLLMRPGMTGLWQVSGRSNLSALEGLELDLHYVRSWTPGLDVRVLLRTPRAILGQRGAY